MRHPLTITCIVENRTVRAGLVAEHGLALWVDTGGHRVLFDTGAGAALPANTAALGIDLSAADAVVLSHGHSDHTGGLDHVMCLAPDATYFAHPAALEPKFRIADGEPPKAIGMSAQCTARLRRGDVHFVPTERPTQIVEGVCVTGEVPRTTDFEHPEKRFFLDPEGRRSDPLSDDQAMVIGLGRRTVVLCGCAHAGVVNVIHATRTLFEVSTLGALIGGLHLRSASEDRLQRTADAIRQLHVGRVAPCHCTDEAAQAYLRQALGHRFRHCKAGTVFTFK
jgi:7,8-dihydropterin-6-yl-methyl-4-(beta-D-ribofuranosyl)aminobenzene 5'-phosphate synthase